jgi:hypothetical protein
MPTPGDIQLGEYLQTQVQTLRTNLLRLEQVTVLVDKPFMQAAMPNPRDMASAPSNKTLRRIHEASPIVAINKVIWAVQSAGSLIECYCVTTVLATRFGGNMSNERKSIPVYVYVMLFVFFPVGIFLLYRHLTSDKTNLMRNSGIMRNFGIGFIVFAVLGFIGGLSGGTSLGVLLTELSIAAGGGVMIYQSNNLRLLAERYRWYIDMVVNHGIRSIPQIAESAQLPTQSVSSDLQNMINMDFFSGAYIDAQSNSIVLKPHHAVQAAPSVMDRCNVDDSGRINITINQTMAANPAAPAAPAVPRAVKCPYCGANSVIGVGEVEQCEYCGSPV